jgi:hypothetical protein
MSFSLSYHHIFRGKMKRLDDTGQVAANSMLHTTTDDDISVLVNTSTLSDVVNRPSPTNTPLLLQSSSNVSPPPSQSSSKRTIVIGRTLRPRRQTNILIAGSLLKRAADVRQLGGPLDPSPLNNNRNSRKSRLVLVYFVSDESEV